jgi:hypothetical protein
MSQLSKHVQDLVSKLAGYVMPHEIKVVHGPDTPLNGVHAGRYLLRRNCGDDRYEWDRGPRVELQDAVSSLWVNHKFDDLQDLASYISNEFKSSSVFVSVKTKPDEVWRARAYAIDAGQPQLGQCVMDIHRHPRWRAWHGEVGAGISMGMSHHQLADLVLDNREDLEQPELADHLAAFRSVRSVEYDADLGDGGHEGVKVQFKGSGGQQGASGNLPVPREIRAAIPAYTGPWNPGDEPKHLAIFRLRVMPPKGDGPPMFRIRWANAADYELEATHALIARVRVVMGDRPVYAGVPSSRRVIIPESSK